MEDQEGKSKSVIVCSKGQTPPSWMIRSEFYNGETWLL